ncbi:MAG: PD-(D/E)XK nuclease family protein [Bacteroidales bacterium]|nr:PD-(D/E)XK nuclease family protein [Bacteroidales bacterium]
MRFSPFSFSKMDVYEKCPYKFKLLYIDKLGTYVPNLAMERGSYIHTLLENETKKEETTFNFKIATPEEQNECFDIFLEFKCSELGKSYLNVPSEAEVNFGVKASNGLFIPCSYWDKEALFRGKIDHSIVEGTRIQLLDWKTGKVSGFPAPLQLVMYAVWAFLKYPHIDTIRTAFVYVEHTEEKVYTFNRKHMNMLQKKILEKIGSMENDKQFSKNETALCDYCDFRSAGICAPVTHDEFQDQMMNLINKPKKEDK